MNVGGVVIALSERPDVLAELTPVPSPSSNRCPTCLTWKVAEESRCENCEEVESELGVPPVPLSLVTLYAEPSRLRNWLTRYKGRPGEDDPWDQESEDVVAALLGRFLHQNGTQLLRGELSADNLVVVPSTERRLPHPLEALLQDLDPNPPLLSAISRSSEPIGFRRPNAAAYLADQTVRGRRLFLVDDVYTTGAHLNSAAQALRAAGAEVVGALVLARRVNPDYNCLARAFWDGARATPFTWDTGPVVRGAKA